MKNFQKQIRVACIVIFSVIVVGCSSTKDYLSDNFAKVRDSHKKIAILPFAAQFQDPNNRSQQQDRRAEKFFSEQEKQASLDAQKELFMALVRQVDKGRYEISFQDFLQTNKILAANGIRIDDIPTHDKVELARLLNVDAIIFGDLTIKVTQLNRSAMVLPYTQNNDGVDAEIKLFDASSGEMLWATNLSQRPNSRMDTPHYLSTQLLGQISKKLPYRVK